MAQEAPYQLIVHAAGLLHRDEIKPEKSYSAIEADALQAVFQVNTFGPALVLRHFLPLLGPRGAMAMLSAKVGSIGDNRLGGWYAYRASKAALNMLIKTAAIELARTRPSKPFVEPSSRHRYFRPVTSPFVAPLPPGRQGSLPMSCYPD